MSYGLYVSDLIGWLKTNAPWLSKQKLKRAGMIKHSKTVLSVISQRTDVANSFSYHNTAVIKRIDRTAQRYGCKVASFITYSRSVMRTKIMTHLRILVFMFFVWKHVFLLIFGMNFVEDYFGAANVFIQKNEVDDDYVVIYLSDCIG